MSRRHSPGGGRTDFPENILRARRVAVHVSGSIAAYKAADVVSHMRRLGAEVRVAMTDGAQRFVTATTFRALSGNPVATSVWDGALTYDHSGGEEGHGMAHLSLSGWAEAHVVVPASANVIARLSNGMADDAVTAGILASGPPAPLVIAPAMETAMWENPVTRANVASLRERGAVFIGPERGRLASGHQGSGRMAEPETVVGAVIRGLAEADSRAGDADRAVADRRWLVGRGVVITAGGTREAIDPVRFLGNRSSGKMGNALAVEAARLGAHVTLITTVAPPPPSPAITVVAVESAEQMDAAVRRALVDAWALIMAAAVADQRPATVAPSKIKKATAGDSLALVPAIDILAALRDDPLRRGRLIVGFAAETDDLIENATEKLTAKGADLMVANAVGDGIGMGTDDTSVAIIGRDGSVSRIGPAPKPAIAAAILQAMRPLVAVPPDIQPGP
jgi:phosphopantothenoylcysteine decarboxylase/phosphopantothenate--cysteine ligase